MKIDLVSVTIDKDAGGAKSPLRDDSARSEQGRAFDQAVQGAAPGRQKGDPAKAKVDASSPDETASEPAAEDEIAAKGTEGAGATTPAADARTLQALLGLLGTQAQAAARIAAQTPASEGEAAADGDPDLAASLRAAAVLTGGTGEAGEGAAKPTKALRLDVLHMETHFEPHQDGMVLVSGEASKASASDAPVAGKLASEGADRLVALLGEGTRKSAATTDAAKADPLTGGTTDEGDADGAPAVRLRFDEALAQLGRGDRDGASAGRGGSAAADIAVAKAEARSTEKTAASSTPALPGAGGLATQVAGPILDALGPAPAAPGTPSSAPGEAHLRMRAGGAAMKTLTIQLQPEHLGTLEVSMRLTDGKLTLELAASQADTAVLLSDDRGTLRKVLEHAGFSLDDAAITVVTRDAAPAASRSADGGSASGQGSDARSSDPQSQRGAGGEGAPGRGSRGETGRQPGEAPSRDGPSLERRSGAHYL
jgi:flagellar hook-length control protein FliK